MDKKELKRQVKIIKKSELFNPKWYLEQYPDVADSGMDPFIHFIKFGGFEKRNPSMFFDSGKYLEMYPDVKNNKFNPLIHYIKYGLDEGRFTNEVKEGFNNKKVEKIILHVGLHKTASTSIQNTLYLNRNNTSLKNKGYLYPSTFPENHSVPIYSMFCKKPEKYHINVYDGKGLEEINRQHEKWKRELNKELANSSCDKLIISGEDISVLAYDELTNFKNYILSATEAKKISVIIYVRNPYSLIKSIYQQHTKNGHYADIFNINYNYEKKISNLQEVFNKENIIIYRFEDAVKSPLGPVEHFYKNVLGFNKAEMKNINIVKANESCSHTAFSICHHINKGKSTFDKNKKINIPYREYQDLLPILKIFKDGPEYKLTYLESLQVTKRSRQTLTYINQLIQTPYSIEPNENLYSESVRYIVPSWRQMKVLKTKYDKINLYVRYKLLQYLYMVYSHKTVVNIARSRKILLHLNIVNIFDFINNDINYPFDYFYKKLNIQAKNTKAIFNSLADFFDSINSFAAIIFKLKAENLGNQEVNYFSDFNKYLEKEWINTRGEKGFCKVLDSDKNLISLKRDLSITSEVEYKDIFVETSRMLESYGIFIVSKELMDIALVLEPANVYTNTKAKEYVDMKICWTNE